MPDTAPLPRLPFSRPTISEAAITEVSEVLRSGWITSGPKVTQFESDFAAWCGAQSAIAFCSATAGLDVVCAALDLQPGDEVITPSINWVSGPNMIELNGGTTVFAEVLPGTLQIDPADVARRITPRTRAIMPVHFAGAPCDLAALRRLTAGTKIQIIEDAAHAAGTRVKGKLVGSDSDVAVFSFHPTKNMTTAEGGMVVCKNAELAARIRLLRFHGIRKDAWKNHGRSGKDLYNVVEPGRKYNLTDIQAVLGIHQLRDLERMNNERARLAAAYRARWSGIRFAKPLDLPTDPSDVHCWHIFIVLIAHGVDRGAVVDHLEAAGIGTALHFPAVHSQTYYRTKYANLSLPISDDIGARLLTIPLFPGMTDADLDRVITAFKRLDREYAI